MKAKLLRLIRYNALSAMCLLAPASVLAAGENHGQLSSADYKFIKEADRGGMAEVQLAQIAKDRATDPAVKQFADKMIRDHSQADQEVADLASKKGATLPMEISASEKRETDHLLKLSGPEFDRAYMKHMVSDHQADVKEFERESKKAADPDVQSWAAKTLPTLQDHLRMAESIETNVKNGTAFKLQ